jgi:tetratricopeptide (TPR) repeat protein
MFYLAFAIERLGEKNWRKESEAGYRAALAQNPYHAPSYYRLGRLLHFKARNAEAEENYRLALALKPDYNEPARALQRMIGAEKKRKKRLGFFT